MTKKTNAAIADGLIRDAKRYNTIRLLAIMTEPERECIMEKMGDHAYFVFEQFDNWVDKLTALLAKSERKNRRVVPEEN